MVITFWTVSFSAHRGNRDYFFLSLNVHTNHLVSLLK